MLDKRFGALRTIGKIFKVLGIISVVAGVVMAVVSIVFLSMHPFANPLNSPMFGARALMGGGIWAGLAALLWGALGGLVLFGSGEVIDLLIAVEENTRASAQLLRQQQNPAAGLPPEKGGNG
jgi:amino acid transporter